MILVKLPPGPNSKIFHLPTPEKNLNGSKRSLRYKTKRLMTLFEMPDTLLLSPLVARDHWDLGLKKDLECHLNILKPRIVMSNATHLQSIYIHLY